LRELRKGYEPYLASLATYFQSSIPPWMAAAGQPDNWQGNIRERSGEEKDRRKGAEHF